ncbi:rhodanese-like domain-containing protein [Dickeya ananatis]
MNNIVDGIDSIRSISVDELKDNAGFLLIDVRESHEYLDGTIPHALTIGRGFLEIELKKRKIELDKPIVLFCASGLRSRYAALNLMLLDYSNIYSLQGGFEAWKAQGNPIEYPLSLSENDKKALRKTSVSARYRYRWPVKNHASEGTGYWSWWSRLIMSVIPRSGRCW